MMEQFESNLTKAVNPPKEKRQSADKQKIALATYNRYIRARDSGHRDYVKNCLRYEDFYMGEQWSKQDLAKLEEQGRPAVTINKILSTINTMSGEQRSRRVDLQFKARSDATEQDAFALTKLTMAIWDANDLDSLESEMYDDGLIRERGYIDLRVGFENNIFGEVEAEKPDSTEVILSPEARSYDPKDWPEVFISKWASLDDIESDFGEEALAEVKAHGYSSRNHGTDFYRFERRTFGDEYTSSIKTDLYDEDAHDIREVRVVERQHYQMVKVFSLVDPATGQTRDLPAGTKQKEAKRLAEMFGTYVIRKTKKRLRVTIVVDTVLLYDDWSIYRSITIVPFFAYFRPGRPFGPIRNLISPQEVYNKTRSQELHIVNTTANSGWIIEKGSLANMDADELADYGSKSGVVIEKNPGKPSPEKIKPNQIPTGIDRISTKTALDIKEVSGVNDGMLGSESPEVSGVALELKEARGQVQLSVIADNLKRTRKILARKILELIQDFYTEERLVRITNEGDAETPNEEMIINQKTDEGILNHVASGEYDVAITTMPARDTYDDVQFAEALNLRSVGIQIPDHRVVQYSHLQHKSEIVSELKDLQGLSEPTPEEQELAAFQQEISLQTAQLNVAKLQAEIAQLQMDAVLKEAKAFSEAEKTDIEHSKMELQAALEEKNAELRRSLAVLSNISKLDAIETQGQMNMATNLLNQQRGTPNGRQ